MKKIVDDSLLDYIQTYKGEKIVLDESRNTFNSIQKKWLLAGTQVKNLSRLVCDGLAVTDNYIIVLSGHEDIAGSYGFYIMDRNYNYVTDIAVSEPVGNVLSVGDKYTSTDPLPLVYTGDGKVWRIDLENETATKVQTFTFASPSSNSRDLYFDAKNGLMYVREKYGSRNDGLNRSDLYKLIMPPPNAGDISIDLSSAIGKSIIRGAYLNQDFEVNADKAYFAAGFGTAAHPNRLYVVDVGSGNIVSVMENISSYEPEGVAIFGGTMYWLDLYGLHEIKFGI